jgi:zinc transporter ZupT
MKVNINTADGRRAAAFIAILGGCIVMTVFAAIGVYLVSGNAALSFWLAIAAHAQILIGMTGLIALFVKRSFKVTRDGVEITDHNNDATPPV